MIYNVNITESRFPLLEFEELNEIKNKLYFYDVGTKKDPPQYKI